MKSNRAHAVATALLFSALAALSLPAQSQGMDMKMNMDGMQGGSAPADARDPHAYSDGYTLDSGKYALPGPRQLHMADEQAFASVLVDRLEAVHADGATRGVYDVLGRVGRDYDHLLLKAEGTVASGKLEESGTEALWGHAVAPFWDTVLGARLDTGTGPSRGWLAFGVQGLAPYWFELSATGYLGEGGRTALRLAAEYELLLTQKLVLQPRAEAVFHGQSDAQRELGSGLSDASAGLRLRYEIDRQFAPYVGVEWGGSFGGTADFRRAAGESTRETRVVAGLRLWF